MATKRTLTQADVELLKETFATKYDLNRALENQELKFEAKITEIKSDFLNKIDPILQEVVKSRDERTLQSDHLSNHGDRIEALEKIHPHSRHLTAI